ncbi:hypothetical protein PC129_g11466 [Phytophthora cactorum]|uniref:Uncharacterized protein n=1 Tax=Phytophthora cactorum TaxID=29920 RepID=A0A8T1HXL3_9STRA|nr:hypothetical protein PC114_g13451 [Phytophthora cactorum]KAG2932485.1 hypothetical protein PC117_g13131 [Phytophthora cactorum]KAG3010846.1 hypothetical protein PC119_g13396 [Phytophthora cactorum]KAG3079400.1 hypothetical protein PC122_g12224 [Phytophthora cactorum]KAG3186942.1 hypothetical protein C6341_g3588 [Phytophthora cactorum]
MVSLSCKLTVFPTLDLVRDDAAVVHRLGVWALIDDQRSVVADSKNREWSVVKRSQLAVDVAVAI